MRKFIKEIVSSAATLAALIPVSLVAGASADHEGHHNLAGQPGDPSKISNTVRVPTEN